MSGPCLSSSVADHPLRPATRLRLGGLLSRQQADRPRDPLEAPSRALARKRCRLRPHPVLIQVSLGYPKLQGRFLTCYAPVRRSLSSRIATRFNTARLACLNHVASVHSEPGSNSPKIFLFQKDIRKSVRDPDDPNFWFSPAVNTFFADELFFVQFLLRFFPKQNPHEKQIRSKQAHCR